MNTEEIAALNQVIDVVSKEVEAFTMSAGLYVSVFCWMPAVFKIRRISLKYFFLGIFCLIFGLAVPGLLLMWTKPLIDSGNLSGAYLLVFTFPLTAVVAGFCAFLMPSVIAFKKKVAHPRWIMGLNLGTVFIPAWPLWLPLLIWSCWEAHQNLPVKSIPKAKGKSK